ncbi:MAG: hypothetical protein GY816_07485 [Cytophagales bacterium]|nr:hypothetical protein [Cytophagales bacterium]
MLEYFKTVLSKVSFDHKLFEKELKKAIKSLIGDDVMILREWCYTHFNEHRLVLNTCFAAY